MVLKRKLPTQAKQEEKKVEKEEKNVDQFDMSIESEMQEESKSTKATEGGDISETDSMDMAQGEKPEDFIPEELRAMEEDSQEEPVEEVKDEVTNVFEEKSLDDKLEDEFSLDLEEETEAVSAEISEEPVFEEPSLETAETVSFEQEEVKEEILEPVAEKEEDITDSFGADEFAEPAELPGETIFHEEESFDSFEKIEEPKEESKEVAAADSFEDLTWEEEAGALEATQDKELQAEDKEPNEFAEESIPSLDDDVLSSVELMGEDHQLLTLNKDAKKKLAIGVLALIAILGAIISFTTGDNKARLAGIKDGKVEDAALLFTEEESKDKESGISEFKEEDDSGFNLLETDSKDETAETQINILETEVVETTASGKEIIKAEGGVSGEEDALKELEDDSSELEALEKETSEEVAKEEKEVNLLESISSEIKKQKEAEGQIIPEETPEEEKPGAPEDYKDVNKEVDEQLAEYRKLLAGEVDPGKKVKPGAFFSGKYKGAEVKKATIEGATEEAAPGVTAEDYVMSGQAIDGHKIITYPDQTPKQAERRIRSLDDFRQYMVKKEDKRVRIPKELRPALRNQGFPKLKIMSIVPNYGLVATYNGKKGALMIGDSIQGWELVSVYRTYAEFKLGNRKHIITLTR